MSADQIAQLMYLVLLTGAIGGFFLLQSRERKSKLVQQAAVWAFIFLGVIAAMGLWSDIRQTVAPRQSVFTEQGRIELPRAPDGHFYMTAQVNGTPIRFVIDTGATGVVLSQRDARRAGIDIETLVYSGQARTANGVVGTAPVRLERISLGGIVDRDVRAWVNGGRMNSSLLGMSYLQRFDKVEISGDRMVLSR